MRVTTVFLIIVMAMFAAVTTCSAESAPTATPVRVLIENNPTALVGLWEHPNGQWRFIGNRQGGTIVVIAPNGEATTHSYEWGGILNVAEIRTSMECCPKFSVRFKNHDELELFDFSQSASPDILPLTRVQ